jgi:hypothetical protein
MGDSETGRKQVLSCQESWFNHCRVQIDAINRKGELINVAVQNDFTKHVAKAAKKG